MHLGRLFIYKVSKMMKYFLAGYAIIRWGWSTG
jgi:hypothetical protein